MKLELTDTIIKNLDPSDRKYTVWNTAGDPGVTGWTLHDLRRTGRTLMANLEIADETAERVLGHSLGGLMAIYNVSRHRKQKMAALVALEAELLRIVNGSNVVPLRLAS